MRELSMLLIFLNLNSFIDDSSSTMLYFEGVKTLQATDECINILNNFAESSSNFTLCSIQNARPVRLCEKCVYNYVNFKNKYDELLNTVVNGTSCKSLFISHDRLEVVLRFHDSILSVWEKGNCKACYDWTDKTPTTSNSTLSYFKLFDETRQCIETNMKQNNTEQVCQTCMHSYIKLDNFYQTLSSDSIGVDSICMDIVDSMNATRFIWSKTLQCCQLRKTPEIIFLCCSGIISILPLFYYLVLRFCGPMRELPNILKQSRFKQTFLKGLSHGRIN